MYSVDALIGEDSHRGAHLEYSVRLSKFQYLGKGVCFLDNHLVLDPTMTIDEMISDPESLGPRVCSWAKAIMLHEPNAFLQMNFKYLDLLDHEFEEESSRTLSMPWATIELLHITESVASYFDDNTGSILKFNILLSPERAHAQDVMPNIMNKISTGQNTVHVFEPPHQFYAQVRHFKVHEGQCMFYDGRFVTKNIELCEWAQSFIKDFPSASATVSIESVDLTHTPIVLSLSFELDNPVLASFDKVVDVFLVPKLKSAQFYSQCQADYVRSIVAGADISTTSLVSPLFQALRVINFATDFFS